MSMKEFFRPSEVLAVLQGFNPWWGGTMPAKQPFKRLGFYVCQKYLADATLRRAILLSGPRRVGKTTILTQLADSLAQTKHEPRGILYLSLDHPLLKLVSLTEILQLYHENVHPAG